MGAWSAAKTEAASLVRSLLEETRLVRFMIDHGPRCTVADEKTTIPVAGSSALQAHVKKLAGLFDFGARDNSNDADRQQANLSQEQNQSQQSGDASKSSEIIIEDDPEGDDDSEERRRIAVSVSRVIQ